MGYEAVELENAFGRSGAEWKGHLGAAKLKACGFHHRLSELQCDKLAQSVEFNQAIGNFNLVIRSLAPEVYTSADVLKKTADEVNRVAESLKPHKLRVGYHNHTSDFGRIEGEYWWNRFADLTSKDVVLQFDTGNAPRSRLRGASLAPRSLLTRAASAPIISSIDTSTMDSPRAPGSFLPLPNAELEILIALADGESHGYAIMQAVAERTEGRRRLGPGTLYTALKRLLAARLIEEVGASRDAGGEEARRRLYRLSHFGSRVLAAELDRLSTLVRHGRRRLHLLPAGRS